MTTDYGPTFGNYATPTVTASAAVQSAIITEINKLKALIPTGAALNVSVNGGVAGAMPDFDQVSPRLANQLRLEIDALTTAIDAMATA